MNLLWIAGLALFVLLEKVHASRWVPVASGAMLVIWGRSSSPVLGDSILWWTLSCS